MVGKYFTICRVLSEVDLPAWLLVPDYYTGTPVFHWVGAIVLTAARDFALRVCECTRVCGYVCLPQSLLMPELSTLH